MAKILLIEDDDQFREMLKQMLSADNHSVSIARDGAEGLQALAGNRPDLIITDILMPNKDGIEMIRELRARDNTIPVIAISGGRRSISAEFNLDSAEMMGVKATLPKPFTRDALRAAIERALGSA